MCRATTFGVFKPPGAGLSEHRRSKVRKIDEIDSAGKVEKDLFFEGDYPAGGNNLTLPAVPCPRPCPIGSKQSPALLSIDFDVLE